MIYNRTIAESIRKDLNEKIVLISGPRQVGKTTLSRQLGFENVEYLNFDESTDRIKIIKKKWSRSVDLVIFDELHKLPKWKSWIKGIYDTEGIKPRLLVTGSARLDVFRKGGDSLAGRHFLYRLLPLSLAELEGQYLPEDVLERLLRTGGFPEPFRKGDTRSVNRWRRNHLDRILREDVLDLEQIRNFKQLEILVDLLADRVGNPLSYRSLALDLQVAPQTVQRWIEVLESTYVVFKIFPYSKNIARSLLKEPKIYFFDIGRVQSEGMRFENLVALSLLKRNYFLEDVEGKKMGLYYLRDKEKREVDFFTVVDNTPEWMIEVKLSDTKISPALQYMAKAIDTASSLQVVKNIEKPYHYGEISVKDAKNWLSGLES